MGGKQIAENIGGWMAIIFIVVVGGGILLSSLFVFGVWTGYLKYIILIIIAIVIVYFMFKSKKHKSYNNPKDLFSFKINTFIK